MAAKALDIYAQILQHSSQMLLLAKEGNWDQLVELGAAREKIVAELKQSERAGLHLSSNEQAEVNALIQETLALDAETAALTEHCMKDIREAMAALGVSKQLNKAYLQP